MNTSGISICLLLATSWSIQAQQLPMVTQVQNQKQLQLASSNPQQFRLHMIDIGTGLAILVEGPDFRLLFDGGSADDKKSNGPLGSKSRLVAYLNSIFGRYAKNTCRSLGDNDVVQQATPPQLDHLFLSHPHEDHLSQLLSVLECFQVKNLWEPGIWHHTSGYSKFRAAAMADKTIRYHTAASQQCNTNSPSKEPCTLRFSAGTLIRLGKYASAKVLHVGDKPAHSPNLYSIVLRLQLGSTSVLLTGDAESGERSRWHDEAAATERYLLQHYAQDLDVDILQVGHHGSLTSSRQQFLQAISPAIALVSSGPKKYGAVVLPDQKVLDALKDQGATIYRTDIHDKSGCRTADKIGVNDAKNPGGCDNYVIAIMSP